ncbi:MAG: ABC transporter ATP-binding protein [Oscillospiraceae bacterium]|nr:ABC transporter ATP-binding protein [Clostridiaceae bacterium]MDY5934026.1 ABC transporter ATP-binding protein [Oscillospiraceae bacterium]
MSENQTALKIENIKKKYVIKHVTKKPDDKRERAKLALYNLTHPKQANQKEDFWALNGVNFEVKQGEKVGIIGKNGAGKSTLLKVISRITEPTDGKIEFYGKISSMLEVGTGFNRELTGRENIYLNGAILGMTRAEIDAKFDDILEFSEVGKFIDTPVKRYSSGMFVRLAFAVASHLEPDILLVDEVLAVGDTRFQKKCIQKMRSIADSGKTILFVSHQMNTIRQLCDRVIVLKEGKVIYDGEVEGGIRLYNSEAYMEKRNHYEYKDLARLPGYNLDKAEILSLDILHNESCIYEADEPIDFKLKLKTKVPDIGDLSFRMLIWQADETPIETAFTKTFANINDVGEYEVEATIRNHNLAPGLYKLTLILSGGNSSSNSENLDYIYPAFVFEVLNADGTSRTWSRSWGWVHFDDVDLKLIEE